MLVTKSSPHDNGNQSDRFSFVIQTGVSSTLLLWCGFNAVPQGLRFFCWSPTKGPIGSAVPPHATCAFGRIVAGRPFLPEEAAEKGSFRDCRRSPRGTSRRGSAASPTPDAGGHRRS